jgi:hypothetical protein
MPGTFVIDTAATFAAPPLLMGCAPKVKYGSTEQDVSATGEKKWEAACAVTFHPGAPGMRPVSEVLNVTVTGPATNPGEHIPPGSPVEFDGFRVGWSAPETRGDGRVRGGKPWFQSTGVRSSLHSGRQVKAAEAS